MTTPNSVRTENDDENNVTRFEEKVQLPFFSAPHQTVSLNMFESVLNARREEELSELRDKVENQEHEQKEKEEYINGYVKFLNENRTVREIADGIEKMLDENGFVDYEDVASGKSQSNRIILRSKKSRKIIGGAVLGTNDVSEKGVKLAASHIDFPDYRPKPVAPLIIEEGQSVKIDLVQNGGFIPSERAGCLYVLKGGYVDENGEWRPLKPIKGEIGALLPHVNRGLDEKKLKEGYSQDQWNFDTHYRNKAALFEAIGLPSEKELNYADIEIVPDNPATMAGDDIISPHQDDISCAFGAVSALIDAANTGTKNTCIFIGTNNEEIGSEGYDGARGSLPKMWITQVVREQRKRHGLGYDWLDESAFMQEKVLQNSICISADVTNAYNSSFSGKLDKKHVAKLGGGVALSSTGRETTRGLTCDTPQETERWLTGVLDRNGIPHQKDMLSGKLDNDAGGLTVSNMYGNLGIMAVEMALPLDHMHSPVEVTAQNDVYNFKRGVRAVYLEK